MPADNTKRRTKILAVASFGGHLVQLKRIIRPMESETEVIYVSTASEAFEKGHTSKFFLVEDFSRSNPGRILQAVNDFRRIINNEKPDVLITTGAAPGLIALIVARAKGVRTLWIDSMANADRLSLCGRIAARLSTRTLTQWPHLAHGHAEYQGNVF